MLKINKGQIFQAQNGNLYVFLGYKTDKSIYYTNLNFEDDEEIMLNDIDIVEEIKSEYNDYVKNYTWYFNCKEELDNSTLEEKLDRCLSNFQNDTNDWEEELIVDNIDFRISKIGSLVKGISYFEQYNQFYETIGFLIETETFKDNESLEKNIGFYAIYHSNCNIYAPKTFFYPFDTNDFTNKKFYNRNSKDYMCVEEVLVNQNDINKWIKENNYDINKYNTKDEYEMNI
ncbi:MAG: hypothetical protein Q4G04_01385 [bacterium]|nr:hypothetical protein [bacterium]